MAKATKKKPAPFVGGHPEHRKAFIKTFETIGRNRSYHEVFSDWLEMAYCTIAKRTTPDKERQEALEKRYMQTVKKYDREAASKMAELLGILAIGVPGGGDFLGSIAGEMELLNTRMGQFFTPFTVSKMMAKMLYVDGMTEVIDDRGFVTMHEPACGAGGMVLAIAECLTEEGYDPSKMLFVEAIDLSETAFKMAYLQMAAAGIPARVLRGNSLSMEMFEAAYTPAFIPFFLMHRRQMEAWRRGDAPTPGAHKLQSRIAAAFQDADLKAKFLAAVR